MNLVRGLAAPSLLACACVVTLAQTPAGPLPMPRLQFFDNSGRPLAGGKVYTYTAGTSTPLVTYTSSTGATPNTNPVVLDAGGFGAIWVTSGTYKIVVTNAAGVQQWSADNVSNTGQVIAAGKGAGGFATLDSGGHLPASQLTTYSQGGTCAATRTISSKLQESVSMEDFAGADCGAKINAAYAALPSVGGFISVHGYCSFSTPINFGTGNKAVVLSGQGRGTNLTYTGTTGTALTLNNGNQFDFSGGIRDLVLSGPGNATGTVGVQLGGALGCVGCSLDHITIQGFGTGLLIGNNEWITRVEQSMIRDNGINLLSPTGLVSAAENIQMSHVVFADAPPPYTNSVWIQMGEFEFTDCSFDSAQLRIGNGTSSNGVVTIQGGHFENPNWVWDPANYDFVAVDAHVANHVRILTSHVEQDKPTGGPPRFLSFAGGKAVIRDLSSYTPAGSPMINLAVLGGSVNLSIYDYDDLACNMTGPLIGGSTTGFVINFAGACTGLSTPRNFVLKPGDTTGAAFFDAGGAHRGPKGGDPRSPAPPRTPTPP